jgi:glycosyltransferase involved in cell wall biosynthesis
MSHVLFISHARGVHGAEAVMVQAIRACAARGVRVTVVVPSIVPDQGMEEVLKGIQGVQILALPYRAAGVHAWRTALVRLYNARALRTLTQYVHREQVSTIYSCSSITILGAALAQATGVRHVWHFHEPVDKRFGWHRSLTGMYRKWVKQTDKILCISQTQQREWEQTLGMKLPNAKIVYNPIKRIETTNPEPHEGIRIGFIGHFEERKNIPTLVRVFERLHTTQPDTALWLCGATGEEDRRYIAEMTTLQQPVLKILPQTQDVAWFYSRIDILVLPSWRETMPLVVLEAMQAGVCVLQTDRSGMKERIADGRESLFFAPENEEELYTLLEKCCTDTEYRQGIAVAGRKKALELVNHSSFDEQIERELCE